MAPKLALLGLPLGVFRLILDLLERSDINTFRLISRACSYVCEPIVFRNVTIHDRTSMAYAINEDICDRLGNSKDALSRHVRHLQIGPLTKEDHCPSESVLVKALNSMQSLQDFSWNLRIAIPKGVLAALHTKQPTARLHATNLSRKQSGAYIPLDTSLLSSPQLHSLTYNVYAIRVRTPYGELEYRSEFAIFSKCLLHAKKLKCLRLSIDEHASNQDCWSAGPMNLTFGDGPPFPALEELALPHRKYNLTASHCRQWLHAMDWSKLQRLDLEHGSPPHLFVALTGRVPQLKALKFGISDHPPMIPNWDCEDMAVVTRFLDSVDGLEEVDALHFEGADFDRIKRAFVEKHGRTLKNLRVHYWAALAKGWKWTDVRHLVEHCPRLQDLTLDIEIGPVWPEATVSEFLKLPLLRNIHLVIQISGSTPELIVSTGHNYFLVEEPAQNYVTALFTRLQKKSPEFLIESVTVTFEAFAMPKSWEFVVTPGVEGEGFVVEKKFVGMSYEPARNPHGGYANPWE